MVHSGKALVTGASRGIGYAIAEELRARGYEVSTPSHSELDLSSMESCAAFAQKHRDTVFDIIVNNAGINEVHPVEEITDDEILRTLQVDLVAPICLIRAFVPGMKKQGYGRIVNIGSIWGVVSKPGRLTYAAAKRGIHGVTQTMAAELAPYNILVNTVCPGFTMTELTRKNNTPEEIKVISEKIPLGRMAQPQEQAKMIAFLASEENTYVTGQQLVVDGGYTAI